MSKRSDDTRQRILAAALGFFAQASFDAASTREIADAAEVTQPLLNYHFKSKEELWKSAVDVLFAELATSLRGRLAGLEGVDSRTQAELLVRHLVRFAAAHPELHRLMTAETKADTARMRWLVDNHIAPLYEFFTDLLAEVRATTRLSNVAPVHAYYMLTGAVWMIFTAAPECERLTGIDPLAPEMVEAHADAIVAVFFGRC